MGIQFDMSDVMEHLTDAETKAQTAIYMYASEGAKKFENYAKNNRPWTDRTGQARQRLNGYVETMPGKVRINIAHGVDYGIYLELCHERKYAILQRTVNTEGPEVLEGFKTLLRRIV